MIFTLRQLEEKCIEQQGQLVAVFIDFAKAFDSVDRQLLWDLLLCYGCPPNFVEVIKSFHTGMHGSTTSRRSKAEVQRRHEETPSDCRRHSHPDRLVSQ